MTDFQRVFVTVLLMVVLGLAIACMTLGTEGPEGRASGPILLPVTTRSLLLTEKTEQEEVRDEVAEGPGVLSILSDGWAWEWVHRSSGDPLPRPSGVASHPEEVSAVAGPEGEGGVQKPPTRRTAEASSAGEALELSVSEEVGAAPPEEAGTGTLTPSEAGHWGAQLSPLQVYGLALYVTGDRWWAEFARTCFTGGGENRGYVGAVNGPNSDGSYDLGIGQSNTGTLSGLGFEDPARALRDPVYAMEALYRTYQVQGAGAWYGCSADGGAG